VRGTVRDESGEIPALWFNRPYLLNQVDESKDWVLFGSVREGKAGLEIVNASCEPGADTELAGRIVAVYPEVGPLSSGFVRRLVDQAFEHLDLGQMIDPLPFEWLDRHGLPPLREALEHLHRPDSSANIDNLNAGRTRWHHRLTYGEFLDLQLELSLLRGMQIDRPKKHRYALDRGVDAQLYDFVPFALTGAQTRTINEILSDLADTKPMLRLLQGDVGSGKTIVAAVSIAAAIESGLQAALMAPTEILTEQHYSTLVKLLGDRYRVEMISASVENAQRILGDVAAGEVQLLVGTHALIHQQVEFKKLGLAIIDEQHRFGVEQRSKLQSKGDRPDLLVMTATPIPRSLALTVYGDLSLSVIDELPPGRSPVKTTILPLSKREQVYQRLRALLAEGAQAFVVVPLIRESSNLAAQSIVSTKKILESHLVGFDIATVHGGMEKEERECVMQSFVSGSTDILLATSVIEVGLDIPNACVMVIENAERFGLAQLHQLRGRVGRGPRPSYCIALYGELTDDGRARLEVFSEVDDGFQIAEADLEIRGPGDLMGRRQSGLPDFRIGDILRDREWLERARRDARELLADDFELSIDREYLDALRFRVEKRYPTLNAG